MVGDSKSSASRPEGAVSLLWLVKVSCVIEDNLRLLNQCAIPYHVMSRDQAVLHGSEKHIS